MEHGLSTKETAAQRLGRFVADLDLDEIPEEVRRAAALHALDLLGCGLAAHSLGEAPYAAAVAREEASSGPASAIGEHEGLPAAPAAFVNGTLCHALDFDDTHPSSVVHVSAAVVPAARRQRRPPGRAAPSCWSPSSVGTRPRSASAARERASFTCAASTRPASAASSARRRRRRACAASTRPRSPTPSGSPAAWHLG